METHVGEGATFAEVAQAAHQQQQQRCDQLTPALPPIFFGLPLAQPLQGRLLGPQPTGESQGGQALQQRFGGARRFKLHPGGAGEQVDAGLLDPRLFPQAFLHGAHTAAAFHPFNFEQQRLVSHAST